MIIDRQHLSWAVFVILATVLAVIGYAANFHPDWLPFQLRLPAFFGPTPPLRGRVGSSPLGLIFGVCAALIFVFAAMLGARRKKPAWRVGRVQIWLKAHIWLSVLTIPLVLLHSGFSLGGPMTQLLLGLFAVVMVSGFWGLALQHIFPRAMKDRLPQEVIFEQIPHILEQLRTEAKKMRESLEPVPAPTVAVAASATTAAADAPVKTELPDESITVLKGFLDLEALPYLAARRGKKLHLGDWRTSSELFRTLKISVTPTWHADVQKIQDWCDERRQLDRQTRLQHWLHSWLFVHAPLSFLLLILTAWHALVTMLRY